MPIQARNIHELAEKLWAGDAIPKREETCVRTIAGRAYYSAYHATRDALRSAYATPDYDVQHTTLANFMIGSGNQTLKTIGNMLKGLLAARELADYDLANTLTHANSEALVDDAREILARQADVEAGFQAVLPRRVERKA